MKVALIELGATHQEVLIPQLKILRESGVEVKIWASDKFIENTLDQSAYINSEVSKIPLKKNKLLSALQCFGISKAVNTFNPDWVIFNTVAGPQISILSKLLSKNIRQAGIVHNTKKISSSKSVKSVCLNLEKIIVLNRELLKWIPNYKEKGFCFYPLTDNEIDTSKKSENVLKIVIPGQVENKRRDYNFLIRQLNRIPADSTIRFNFLGNAFHPKGSGPELNDSINSLKNTFGIKLLSAPVPEKEFQDEINSSDLILPLITPTCEGFDNYLKYQISGTYNLSFSLKKPMLIHEKFNQFEDFKDTAIFYNEDNFIDKLNELTSDKSILENLESALKTSPIWNKDQIRANYISMLRS